jgi:hypothetical protein
MNAMTKNEIKMTKEAQRMKHEDAPHLVPFVIRCWGFVILSSFRFRRSSLPCYWPLLLSTALMALSGASCPQTFQRYVNPLPRVLPPSPTLEQVIAVVNRNSSQIRSFSTNHASLSGQGVPALGASVAFERPLRFRLRAQGAFGTEADLGSNDELFWFWLRRSQPPAMYYCRHDQFAASPARQTTPFEPKWLIEALGVMEFDPALPHQGPYPMPNDRLRIDTICNMPDGPVTKITVIDASQGWVLEQHVYDARHKLLARSVATGHRVDPASGLVMPTAVEITFPNPGGPAGGERMRISLGNVEINRPSGDPATLWAMPNYPSVPLVDLADPRNSPPAAGPAQAASVQRPPQSNWRAPAR